MGAYTPAGQGLINPSVYRFPTYSNGYDEDGNRAIKPINDWGEMIKFGRNSWLAAWGYSRGTHSQSMKADNTQLVLVVWGSREEMALCGTLSVLVTFAGQAK